MQSDSFQSGHGKKSVLPITTKGARGDESRRIRQALA